jgi:hypothetical protein
MKTVTVEDLNREFNAALHARLRAEYQRGLRDGLEVAYQIRDWLTRQPDTRWQRQVRTWAERAIAKARKELQ